VVAALDPVQEIVGVDLGVLPGDARSEATFVTEDGAVYGYSYAPGPPGGSRRAFRWTAATGMQPASSIPAGTSYPLPGVSGLPGDVVFPLAANAKGEATGAFCRVFHGGGAEGEFDCPADLTSVLREHPRAFRHSRGGGLQDLDPHVPDPGDSPNSAVGLAINRWGHVGGLFRPRGLDDWRAMLWTPIDSMALTGVLNLLEDPRQVLLNDNDRLVASSYNVLGLHLFSYEPAAVLRRLLPPNGDNLSGEAETVARAQNNGALVVGRSDYWYYPGGVDEYGNPIQEWRSRAVVWTLPPVSRAAYPKVNANPIAFTSTISLRATGGRYFQFYRATQGPYAGPYMEHVDWGDGTWSRRTRTAIGNVVSQSHVYTRTGSYWIRVYVKDALGRWGVAERRLTVTP
jgi:hypothetical protein